MTTGVQRRRGTTVQHSTFTGLEGEITVDTTKDTAVVHDGTTVGGHPLAKQSLSNVDPTALDSLTGVGTASGDLFLVYDVSTSSFKKITRDELNNAIEQDALANVTITGGSINGTTIGASVTSSGKFTTLESSSTTTLNGTSIPASKTLLVTTDIGSTVQAYDADLTTLGAGGSAARSFLGLAIGTDVQAYDATILKSANIGVTVQAYDADLAAFALKTAPTGDVVGTSDSQTLSNKTMNSGSIWNGTTIGIAYGGTGQTTANAAFNALVPSQTGNSGKFLTTDGTNTSWSVNPLGTVTSVSGTGTVNGLTLTGTVTTSGSLTLGGTLDLSSPPTIGSTTPNSGAFTTLSASGAVTLSGGTANGVLYLNGSKVATSGTGLVFDGTNLGVGVTPSAWSGFAALDIGSGGLGFYSAGMQQNAYYNGSNWIYKTTNPAAQYLQSGGQHRWWIAPSGTAGNAISFTQAMTLDASGNLGIGTTSTFATSNKELSINTASGLSGISLGVAGSLVSWLNSNTTATTLSTYTSTPLTFGTNNAERMRIDSSGDLYFGTGASLAGRTRFNLVGVTSGVNGIGIRNASDTGTIYSVFFQNASGTLIGSISNNGSNTSYTTSSDYRLKENIAPMTGALNVVQQLKPVTYDWVADKSKGQGFIAHELQAVVPDCVTGEKDAVDEEGNPKYQGIDTSFLVATLTAAIQELNAKVTALEAQLGAK